MMDVNNQQICGSPEAKKMIAGKKHPEEVPISRTGGRMNKL
jgi:hypothetical protein